MKTKAIYLAAFLLMTVVATFGSDEPKKASIAVMPVKGAEVFKVIYKSEIPGRVKMILYSENSQIVFSGTFNNTDGGFILPLNFSKLSFGEYKLELIDGKGKSTEKIVYQPAKSADNIRIVKLANEQDKFIVAVSNPKNEKVTVRIFDSYNNLIHDEVNSVKGDFAQVYNVKNLTGTFTFEVSVNAGTVKSVQF